MLKKSFIKTNNIWFWRNYELKLRTIKGLWKYWIIHDRVMVVCDGFRQYRGTSYLDCGWWPPYWPIWIYNQRKKLCKIKQETSKIFGKMLLKRLNLVKQDDKRDCFGSKRK